VSQRLHGAALVSGLVATAVVALAACGGVSGASPGAAVQAGDHAAAAGNGAARTTGPAAGSPPTAGGVLLQGSNAGTSGVSTANGGGQATANGLPPSPIVPTMSGGTPAGPGAQSAGGSTPTPPAPQLATGSSTEAQATMPAAAQALSCPRTGAPSGDVNSFGWGQVIPAGFQPVAAVRCVPASSTPPPSGQLPYVQKEVAVSGLGPLLTALLEPSATLGGSVPAPRCLAPAAGIFQLALIGADGSVIEPLIPVTVCGGPIQPVVASITALNWTTVN